MNRVLLYSRKSSESVDLLIKGLQEIGYSIEQTQSLNLPRLVLNPYNTVHFLVDELPLTVKETLFMSLVKSLGKVTILSVFNINHGESKKLFEFLYPDALTVSQTDHLKFFRQWNCPKMILPLVPNLLLTKVAQLNSPTNEFLVPLISSIDEAVQFKTAHNIYFDARKILEKSSSAKLRKAWSQLIQDQEISSNYHLILSEQKIKQLLEESSLSVVLANPKISHTDFIHWLEIAVNKNNLVILNDGQATSFSQAWTSGQNCHVVSNHAWVEGTNELMKNQKDLRIKTHFKSAQLVEPLINELSRLYTKILHQKTSLLSTPSANINK